METATASPATLQLEQVSVRYGGVQALQDVSLRIAPGRVYGLIGPNGAGKSTTINVIAGFTQASSGRVRFQGSDIGAWAPHQRARAGLARTFQNLALFGSMTVRENVACGAAAAGSRCPASAREALVDAELQRFGLAAVQHEPMAVQSLGTRKRIELARALVGKPALLLLDEPAAGLSADEIRALSDAVRAVCRTGASVLLIEHDMELVMGLCEHLFVLDFGKLIAQGTPDAVRADAAVQAAYFGAADELC
ncbi:ABC transporter ATP-binding protein [Pseudorhodoferax sp.]|uniref:ABC transporter ATP-binding protein n=1 Tax=Pseudorhodoferax sp. TaxID=1993553 RepID=UPI002DD69838|nr:ABC transporter ATP-binding protein [Pseudorhodoferax sp.]